MAHIYSQIHFESEVPTILGESLLVPVTTAYFILLESNNNDDEFFMFYCKFFIQYFKQQNINKYL